MDKKTAGPNSQPEHHTSFWCVGLILLGAVIVVLVAAFLLNQHFKPHVGIEPSVRTPDRSASTSTSHTGGVAPATAQSTGPVLATPVSTVPPTPVLGSRQQVVRAYHNYWQDYREALYTLDTTGMARVAEGTELHRVVAEVAALRQRARAVHVLVSHSALIVSVKGNSATLYDQQTDRSFLINPSTKEPRNGSAPPFVEKDIYYLQKIHSAWMVVKSLRQR